MAHTITPRGILTREPNRRPIGRLVGAGAIVGLLLLTAGTAASIIRSEGVTGITLRSLIDVYLPSSEREPVVMAVPTRSEYEFERVFGIERALAAGKAASDPAEISPSGGPVASYSAEDQIDGTEPLQIEIMGLNDGQPFKAVR